MNKKESLALFQSALPVSIDDLQGNWLVEIDNNRENKKHIHGNSGVNLYADAIKWGHFKLKQKDNFVIFNYSTRYTKNLFTPHLIDRVRKINSVTMIGEIVKCGFRKERRICFFMMHKLS